jgi:hypothetical protein
LALLAFLLKIDDCLMTGLLTETVEQLRLSLHHSVNLADAEFAYDRVQSRPSLLICLPVHSDDTRTALKYWPLWVSVAALWAGTCILRCDSLTRPSFGWSQSSSRKTRSWFRSTIGCCR